MHVTSGVILVGSRKCRPLPLKLEQGTNRLASCSANNTLETIRSPFIIAENEAHVIKSDLFTILQDRFMYLYKFAESQKTYCEVYLKNPNHHIKTLLLTLGRKPAYLINGYIFSSHVKLANYTCLS